MSKEPMTEERKIHLMHVAQAIKSYAAVGTMGLTRPNPYNSRISVADVLRHRIDKSPDVKVLEIGPTASLAQMTNVIAGAEIERDLIVNFSHCGPKGGMKSVSVMPNLKGVSHECTKTT